MPLEPDQNQERVLAHQRGALLVTGPAGTGKTEALRERFARLIEGGADPERVVLVVRSRQARAETRAALLDRLHASLPDLRVLTVHGLARHVLEARFDALGYQEPPAIVGAADQFSKVRELLAGESAEQWPAYGSMLGLRGFADEVRQFLFRAQESMLEPERIAQQAKAAGLSGWSELADFYRRYLDVLGDLKAVDFAGLVWQAAVAAPKGEPLFDEVLVDDYQDATLAAEALLTGLGAGSLVVAGYQGAHVFSFQGTTDIPIRRFEERVPGAERIELDEQHRSPERTAEAWFTSHTSEEYSAIARELRRIHVEDGVPWGDLAVVVRRKGTHLGGLLRALDDGGIPRATPESGLSLLAEPATFPFILAFRWLVRPDERDTLIEPLLTSELARLTPAAARGLARAASASGGDKAGAIDREDGLSDREREGLETLRSVLVRAEPLAHRSALDTFRLLWRELPYSERLVAETEVSADARRGLDAVLSLSDAISRTGDSSDQSVDAFLGLIEAGEEGPGFGEPGGGQQASVGVLTAHGAAGEEFDTVIVAGAVEGNFPSLSRPEPMFDLATLEHRVSQSERNRFRLEDERRLFNLVVNRARRRVLFTSSDAHDDPALTARSRFVDEAGAAWKRATLAVEGEPLSVAEAAAEWRRSLADLEASQAVRLAALQGLIALGIDPARWWFQRDWTDPGGTLHPDGIRTSYSRLDTLDNCELQYVLGEELGLDARSGYHAQVGHLVHKLIEESESGKIERNEQALVEEIEKRWRQEWFPSFAVSEAFRRRVTQTMIPNWVGAYGKIPAVGSEIRFEFEHDDATVTGFIDRIGPILSGGNRITDFKTGKPDNAPPAEDNLQLGIYYLAVQRAEELEQFRPVRGVELSFLRGNWRTSELERKGFQLTARGLEGYEEMVETRLSELIGKLRELNESGVYRADPEAACRFCSFKPLCPLWPEGAELFPAKPAEGS
ncbi:MAG: ATP-dependent DNA helicase [Actinomycetota bacterium]